MDVMFVLFVFIFNFMYVFLFVYVTLTFDMSLIPFMRLLVRSVLCNKLQESVFGSRSMTCWLKILRSKSARLELGRKAFNENRSTRHQLGLQIRYILLFLRSL